MIISVITPTLNSEQWIRACIASVQLQVAPGLEIEHVIVDGGSTDATVEIATREGCVVVADEDDKGLYDAANKGVARSTGQLFGFLGSDDVLLPGGLDAIARRYASSGRRWVTGSYVWADEHFRELGRIAAPPEWLTPSLHAMLGWCYHLNMATYLERSLFDELGGYDLGFPVGADYKLILEAQEIGPFAREPQTIAVYRRHGGNKSMSLAADEEYAYFVRRFGPEGALRQIAYRYAIKAWVNFRNPYWMYRKFNPLPPIEPTNTSG